MDMVVKGQGGKGSKGHSEAAMLSSQLLDLGPIKMRHWYGGAYLGKTHDTCLMIFVSFKTKSFTNHKQDGLF